MAKKKGTGNKSKKKLLELLDDNFEEVAQNLSETEIKEQIAQSARLVIGYKKTMKEDPAVLQAQKGLEDAKGQYIEDIKACNAKIEYLSTVLDERGAVCQ